MGSFLVSDLSNYDWVCLARGDKLESTGLLYNDLNHGDAEPDRPIASYPYTQLEVSELRCPCGSLVAPIPKV